MLSICCIQHSRCNLAYLSHLHFKWTKMLLRIRLSVPALYYGGWLQRQTRDGLQARSTRCLPPDNTMDGTTQRHWETSKNNRGPQGTVSRCLLSSSVPLLHNRFYNPGRRSISLGCLVMGCDREPLKVGSLLRNDQCW